MTQSFRWTWSYLNPLIPPVNKPARTMIHWLASGFNFALLYPMTELKSWFVLLPANPAWLPLTTLVGMVLLITPYLLTTAVLKILTDYLLLPKKPPRRLR